jgi:CO/xanthine dehydrogenase FAD-binding subunit
MAVRIDEVSAPTTMVEAVSILRRHPEAILWAGGTLAMTGDDRMSGDRHVSILDLGGIQELLTINKSDRYLELGALVPLADILALPASLSLEPLRQAMRLVGTAAVRNLATLGGNLASQAAFMTCFAALACMDAAVELRDAQGARWTGIHSLIGEDSRPLFPPATILTRIRIPAAPWDTAIIRRLGEQTPGEAHPASFAATARFEKGTISEIRLVAAGPRLVRDRALELSLVGQRLPLGTKETDSATNETCKKALESGFDAYRSRKYGAYVGAFLGGIFEEAQ